MNAGCHTRARASSVTRAPSNIAHYREAASHSQGEGTAAVRLTLSSASAANSPALWVAHGGRGEWGGREAAHWILSAAVQAPRKTAECGKRPCSSGRVVHDSATEGEYYPSTKCLSKKRALRIIRLAPKVSKASPKYINCLRCQPPPPRLSTFPSGRGWPTTRATTAKGRKDRILESCLFMFRWSEVVRQINPAIYFEGDPIQPQSKVWRL